MAFRIRTHAAPLGFVPPPAHVQLQFLRGVLRWGLLIDAPTLSGAQVTEWVRRHAPAPTAAAISTTGSIHGFEYYRLPPDWRELHDRFVVQNLSLRPDGQAVLEAQGPRHALDDLVERAAGAPLAPRVHILGAVPGAAPELTTTQTETLLRALMAGYYDSPRRASLTALARQIGITPAALSTLLRRGEKSLLSFYFHVPMDKPGKARRGRR